MKPRKSLFTLSAVVSLGIALCPPTRGADTILHNFTGDFTGNDGAAPLGSLTLSGSKLYGTTQGGGNNPSGSREGAIFSINLDGSGFNLLHSFSYDGIDGLVPSGSLTLSGSTLFGMTQSGGSNDKGTLYRINSDGTGYSRLYSFTGGTAGGATPTNSLTLFGSKLYGLTYQGGSGNKGTIFSVNTDGTGFSLLHSFNGGATDGAFPGFLGSLTLSGSKLYGMTNRGGSGDYGTIFSVNTDGTGFNLLHAFADGSPDGELPFGSLTLLGSKLYGMAWGGGGAGTLFSLNTDGTGFNPLHTFAGTDGANPTGSLTLYGTKLYGMARDGGDTINGTLFSINTDGTGFTLLHSFAGEPNDGADPNNDVTIAADGQTLYGMTTYGGTGHFGVIFSAPTGIPEPSSALLLSGSGFALLLCKRRNSTF